MAEQMGLEPLSTAVATKRQKTVKLSEPSKKKRWHKNTEKIKLLTGNDEEDTKLWIGEIYEFCFFGSTV